MPPRIAYWTSSFEPDIEAIASEVATLRRHFPGSITWGLSHRHDYLFCPRRGFCLHPRFHLLFRVFVRIFEKFFDLNHVVGSLGDWFYLQGKRQRPTILTVAACSPPVGKSLLDRIAQFVVEYPRGHDELRQLGIESDRIRLIFLPVNLNKFFPRFSPPSRFTVLFASSPEKAEWLAARGVPLILDAATLRPDFWFRLLWRPWGDSLAQVLQMISDRGLTNVEVVLGRQRDMAAQYQNAHVTILPFTRKDRCKPAPNSLVESLASGRPVLVTDVVGLSDMIAEAKGGTVCESSAQSIAVSLDRLQTDWVFHSAEARKLASRWFSKDTFLKAYERLYRDVLKDSWV